MLNYQERSIRSRIRYYAKRRNRSKVVSRLFLGVGVLGFILILVSYSLYSDSVLGLSSISVDTCFLTFGIGMIISVIGAGLSISTGNDAEEYQMRLDHIRGRIDR